MPHTSSHIAHLHNIETLNLYLDSGGDVNEKDDKSYTLLHVTVYYNKDDRDKNKEIIETLIQKGADVDAENLFGETPLYLAVLHSNDLALDHLLKAGANLIFKRENALHLAGEVGYVKNVELLLADPRCTEELVNALDDEGRSPAYRAAITSHKFSLKRFALAGADLSFKYKDRSIMEVIFEEITRPEDWIVDLLDEGITCEVDAQKHSYVVDFSILAPKTNVKQLDVLVDIIGAANLQEENVVLQHPLIEFLLILKWAKLCYFYYYILVTFAVFALSLSFYGFSLNVEQGGQREQLMINPEVYRLLTAFSGFLLCLHVGLKCLLNRKEFMKFESVAGLLLLILIVVVALIGDGVREFQAQTDPDSPDLVLQMLSVILLFVWMELMSLLGRLPALGYYAIMFTTVLKNVLKVLSIFVCLLLGFALSFSIQFRKSPEFSNPWKALVKTTVMMAGEFEYTTLYGGDMTDTKFSVVLSRFLFLMFIILNSIVLMNLMIALAASDIQSLQVHSHARKMKNQAYFLNHMEKVILYKQLTASYVPEFVVRFIESRRHVRTRYEFTKSMRHSRNIPSKLIEHIKKIGKEHKKIVA